MASKVRRAVRRPTRRWNWSSWTFILVTAGLIVGAFRISDTPWRIFRLGNVKDLGGSIDKVVKKLDLAAPEKMRADESKPKGQISIRWSKDRESAASSNPSSSILDTPKLVESGVVSSSEVTHKDRLRRSIVFVRGVSNNRSLTPGGLFLTKRKFGHGFVVERNRDLSLIVTAAHVLRGALPEVSASPEGPYLPAELLYSDPVADLALLRVSKRVLPDASPVSFAPTSLRPGETCWVVNAEQNYNLVGGKVLGRTADAREAIADVIGVERADTDWFLISQSGHRGLSGSPVLSKSGKVVGVLIGGIEFPEDRDISIVMGPQAIGSLLHHG